MKLDQEMATKVGLKKVAMQLRGIISGFHWDTN
jgi:hypothetical protein